MILKVKKLSGSEDLPTVAYAHDGDAAFDLYASKRISIEPHERVQVPTGIALALSFGYAGLIWDKSGLSHKHGLRTLGGVVDASYRGEVMVGMINLSDETYVFERGNKVAQMVIQKVEHCEIEVVDNLDDTSRGEGGFGSTGK